MQKINAAKTDPSNFNDAMETAVRARDKYEISVHTAFSPSNVLTLFEHVAARKDVKSAGEVYQQMLSTRFELFQLQFAAQVYTHKRTDQISVDLARELHAQVIEYNKFYTPAFHMFQYPNCRGKRPCNGACQWWDIYGKTGCFRKPTASYSVSCGGHHAYSCGDCGPHPSYCNGDCKWMDVYGKKGCFAKADSQHSVRCGGHSAYSCQDCGPSSLYCNSDCKWIDVHGRRGCYRKPSGSHSVSCGNHNMFSCRECGPSKKWSNGDCTFVSLPGGDAHSNGFSNDGGGCIEKLKNTLTFNFSDPSSIVV